MLAYWQNLKTMTNDNDSKTLGSSSNLNGNFSLVLLCIILAVNLEQVFFVMLGR